MAIYGNALNWNSDDRHCVFESSNLKSSIVGNIYDAIVRDGEDKEVAIDNGMPIVVGDFTGDGLQTRWAKVAGKGDKIAVVGTPALIKDAHSKQSEQPYNFYNKAGSVAKAYEVVAEDIFGVSKEFVDGDVVVGATVVWNPTSGKYEVASGVTTDNGFVAKVHSIQVGTFYDLVRLFVVKNETV